MYDQSNPFARILRGELPCEPIHESEFALAIHDEDPQAPYHALVLAKGHYTDLEQFVHEATPEQVHGFFRAVGETARKLGLVEGGYRVVTNRGPDAGQTVPHLHLHILGGGKLGPVAGARPKRQLRSRAKAPVPSMPGEAGERAVEPRAPIMNDPKRHPEGGPDA